MKRQNLSEVWKERFKPLFTKKYLESLVKTMHDRVRYVNLDNAATTPPFKVIKSRVNSAFDSYGSIHRGAGQNSQITTERYEGAREQLRRFVNASPENYVLFTKNTTESINQAAALLVTVPGKVLVSDIEHSSNLLPWLKNGKIVQYKTNPDSTVNLGSIEKALREGTGSIKLVTITGSSNVTGYRPPLDEIARLAHSYGAKILVDACQLVPHAKLDIKADNDPAHLDFVAFSGHKMYAPYGSGVLIGPKSFFDEVMPYQIGGGNLPYITKDLNIIRFQTVRAHDPGTANFVGALAMAEASKTLDAISYDTIAEYEHALVSQTCDELKQITGVTVYAPEGHLSSVIPFEIKGFDSRLTAVILAKEHGIGVRAGSFCTYELLRKLKGITDAQDSQIADEVRSGITKNIPGLVRASFGLANRPEDSERLVQAVREIIQNGPQNYSSAYCQNPTTGAWIPR